MKHILEMVRAEILCGYCGRPIKNSNHQDDDGIYYCSRQHLSFAEEANNEMVTDVIHFISDDIRADLHEDWQDFEGV